VAGAVPRYPAIATRVLAWSGSRERRGDDVFPELTRRERKILDELAQGHGNQTIARHLSISAKTVANHRSTIFDKLQGADRGEAIVRAREAGFGGKGPS
jgi:DNA-binding NarL/FixJ family response regulator